MTDPLTETEEAEKPPCAVCGIYHRYATTDPEHEWVATACMNSMFHEFYSAAEVVPDRVHALIERHHEALATLDAERRKREELERMIMAEIKWRTTAQAALSAANKQVRGLRVEAHAMRNHLWSCHGCDYPHDNCALTPTTEEET